MNHDIAVPTVRHRRRLDVAYLIGAMILMVSLCLSIMAVAPSPASVLAPLTQLAISIDASAKSGDWLTADRRHVALAKQWAVRRLGVVRSLKGTAHAQSIDSSMKYMQVAIEQRSAADVHRAAYNIQKSIHEISEIPPPHA
jgi:hypothetical protein